MKGNEDEDDNGPSSRSDSNQELSFMSTEQVLEVLQVQVKECDDNEFLEEISEFIYRPLCRKYQEVAKSIFVSSSGTSASVKRKSHQDYQEKINGLTINMRLFEKGANLFEGDTSTLLYKHLLKTIATDVVNIIFEMVAIENLMSLSENEKFTNETRLKLLNKLSIDWKAPMTKLNSSLSNKDTEDFFKQLDIITGSEYCDIMIKKIDKKKERQLLFNHRQALADQLERETEAAMALHLVCVILFQYHTNTLLHAPGRCVPQIITYLQNNITVAEFKMLNDYQKLIVQQVTEKSRKSESETDETDVTEDSKSPGILLAEGITSIKMLVKTMKKQTTIEE